MAKTVVETTSWRFFRRVLQLLIVLLIFAALNFVTGFEFRAAIEGLTPPQMRPVDTTGTPRRLKQNWPPSISRRFHSISQGTRTLPLPLSWLLALEQPRQSLLSVPFGRSGRFMDNEYILRFGFIKGEVSEYNPLGLPVGIAVTPGQVLSGVDDTEDAVGFTCAACHTAQLNHGDQQFLVDGGPASTDLGLLTSALGAALGQTAVSAELPFFKARFNRFARGVLGDAYSDQRAGQLKAELDALVANLAALPSAVDVVEGFSRLDALNRIGNQTFALDTGRFENYVPINAPVNYPHIWTSSWFDWVQYDASIMAPLIRNTGEALGVNAAMNVTAPRGEHRFASSANLEHLVWIEDSLAGPAPAPTQTFTGLLAPAWPGEFGAVDTALAEKGRGLYQTHCQECHLPTLDSPQIWDHFSQIEYYKSGELLQSPDKVLRLNAISLKDIGTDPAQAMVLVQRRVDTAGNAAGTPDTHTPGLGLDAVVCGVEPVEFAKPDVGWPQPKPGQQGWASEKLVEVTVTDGPNELFALALGAIVQQVNDAWFAQNYTPETQQRVYERGRPNCLRAGAGYKARPLNGVWSTGPFLHNGSVPSIYDLLSPPGERPALVQLGSKDFDAKKLGVLQDAGLANEINKHSQQRYVDGYFVLDTKLPGNGNSGHEFSGRWQAAKSWGEQERGVIGPELTHEQRMALLEFLKTQ